MHQTVLLREVGVNKQEGKGEECNIVHIEEVVTTLVISIGRKGVRLVKLCRGKLETTLCLLVRMLIRMCIKQIGWAQTE